jgi:hypothetical protein
MLVEQKIVAFALGHPGLGPEAVRPSVCEVGADC